MTILSPSEEKALRKQYYNESLFRNLAPVLKELVDQSNMKHISVVYIWKTASELCRELGQSACPEFEIKELLSDLRCNRHFW